MSDILTKCLEEVAVAIDLKSGLGSGVWVGPGLILTCAHVVDEAYASGTTVSIRWREVGLKGTVGDISTDLDIALVDVPIEGPASKHPIAVLHNECTLGDKLYGFGYSEAYPNGEPYSPEVEGMSPDPRMIKLKFAQVVPGFSGSPLLNLRTGAVCGITRRTRDRAIDLGGRAAPIDSILSTFRSVADAQAAIRADEGSWIPKLNQEQRRLIGLGVPHQSLLEQVKGLYKFLGFKQLAYSTDLSNGIDLIVKRTIGNIKIFRAIKIINGKFDISNIHIVLNALRLAKVDFPDILPEIIYTGTDTLRLSEYSSKFGIQITSIGELERSLLDGISYADYLLIELSNNERYKFNVYVEPLIAEELQGSAGIPADQVIKDWLNDPEWKQLTLLGDVGTGKTFFTRHLAQQLAQKYIQSPEKERLPIRIDLRDADRLLSLQGLVVSHLHEYGLRDIGLDVFLHAAHSGRLVVIFDGFDEMAARVTPAITNRNFQELSRVVSGKSKVLLTCRTHYFRSRLEEESVVLGEGSSYTSDHARELYWDLIAKKGFKIAYLRPFTFPQIEEYVKRVKGDGAPDAIRKIRSIYNLEELCQRPMLLDMIVKTIHKIDINSISPASLYQVFTDAWIYRDKWRDVLTSTDKLDLLTGLARCLFLDNSPGSIHHSLLSEYVRTELASRLLDSTHYIEIDSEIRTASFLTRDDAGNYGFAHKSYREFFYARYLHANLRKNNIFVLADALITQEVFLFLADMPEVANIDSFLEQTLISTYRKAITENSLLALYLIRKRIALKTGSSLIISMPSNMRLDRAALDRMILDGCIFMGTSFAHCTACESTFRSCVFDQCDLTFADLSYTNLTDSLLKQSTAYKVILRDAVLSNVSAQASTFELADFNRADLQGARFANCNVNQVQYLNIHLPDNLMTPDNMLFLEYLYMIRPDISPRDEIQNVYPRLLFFINGQIMKYYSSIEATDAQDIVQDVLVQLFLNDSKYRLMNSEQLFATCCEIALQKINYQLENKTRHFTDIDYLFAVSDDQEYDPIRHMRSLEIRPLVHAEINRLLSGDMYNLIYDVYINEYPISDVASRLDMSSDHAQELLKQSLEILSKSSQLQRLI